ncbi:MAG: KH domain-containing protein [bacterium]|nr:KH domain-containing protein [bacterium]
MDSTPPEADELDIKTLVEAIAKSIVDSPERVVVSGVAGENSTVLELRVAKEDIGKVIGKNGRTITAMRTILNATRAQKFKRHILEVLE